MHSLLHGIGREQMPQQQRRVRVMEFVIFTGLLPVRICIAVFAAVKAGVIRSYVPALNAMAALPHSLMFQVAELNAVGLSQNVQGHAAGG